MRVIENVPAADGPAIIARLEAEGRRVAWCSSEPGVFPDGGSIFVLEDDEPSRPGFIRIGRLRITGKNSHSEQRFGLERTFHARELKQRWSPVDTEALAHNLAGTFNRGIAARPAAVSEEDGTNAR